MPVAYFLGSSTLSCRGLSRGIKSGDGLGSLFGGDKTRAMYPDLTGMPLPIIIGR